MAGTTTSRARLANDTWESLLVAHSVLMKHFAAGPMWDTVTMREYDVLYTLSKCPEPQRLADLGKHLVLSQPGLSRLVDRLVDHGLVSRCADSADARAVRLSLTEAGRQLQREIGLQHGRDVTSVMTSALSDEELKTLATLTHKLASQEKS